MRNRELFKKVDSALKEKSEIAYTNQLKNTMKFVTYHTYFNTSNQ